MNFSSLRTGGGAAMFAALSTVFVALPQQTDAACNVIPAATSVYRSSLGALNRPFAGPGEFVELRVRPEICDGESTGFIDLGGSPGASDDYVVTVLFTPPNGVANAVVLAEDCNGIDLASCDADLAGGTSDCRVVNDLANPNGLVVQNDNELQFRFPDTDDRTGGPTDLRTLSGPAKIVVTRRAEALRCDVAATRCADAGGSPVFCGDEFYPNDGTCRTLASLRRSSFSHFTALPPTNNVEQMVTAPALTEMRMTTDIDGNILAPMDYSRLLIRSGDVPVPQLLRFESPLEAFFGGGVAASVPSEEFVAAYSPEGIILPPVFRPVSDPNAAATLSFFGSVDAPHSVARVVRQGCVGGNDEGVTCSLNSDCSSNTCSAALFEFRDRYDDGGVGPVVVGTGGPGQNYETTLDVPVPLDGLVESEDTFAFVLSEPLDGISRNDDSDFTDTAIVTLRDNSSGQIVPIGPGGSEGRAAPRIRENEFAYPAVEAEGTVVAFLESEPLQDSTDTNANGSVFDTVLRVFRLDPGPVATELTSAGTPPTADANPVINGRSITVSNQQVFFLAPESVIADQVTERVSVDSGGTESDGQSFNPSISENGEVVAFSTDATNLIPMDTNGTNRDIMVHDRVTGVTEIVSIDTGGVQTAGGALGGKLSDDGRQVAVMTSSSLAPDAFGSTPGTFHWYVRDRDAAQTVRVSVDSSGAGFVSANRAFHGMSADGRVIGYSANTDWVTGDTNTFRDVYVHDRDADSDGIFDEQMQVGGIATVNASVDSFGAQPTTNTVAPLVDPDSGGTAAMDQANGMSADGSRLVFRSQAEELDPANHSLAGAQIYLRDLETQTTELVSLNDLGVNADGNVFYPDISGDGRYVSFTTGANNLIPGVSVLGSTAYLRDTERNRLRLVGADNQGNAVAGIQRQALSDDARFIVFASDDDTAVAGDTNARRDIFVRDILTGVTNRVSVSTAGAEADFGSMDGGGGSVSGFAVAISGNGRTVSFASNATNLVAGDTNYDGFVEASGEDVFVRGPDLTDLSADLSGDGDIHDTVLRILDASGGAPAAITTLCPATEIAVDGSTAAFLRPESAGVSTAADCTGASLSGPDLNGDLDETDDVVHFWDGAAVTNLRCSATAVALTASYVAALVSEAGEDTDLNSDGDKDDDVVHIRDLTAGAPANCSDPDWINTGAAGHALALKAGTVTFLSRESDEGGDLNGDGDSLDTVIRLADAATGALIPLVDPGGLPVLPQAAEEFVMSDTIVAFRTLEASQAGLDLNGDLDTNDGVLQVYDLLTGALHSSGFAVLPCPLLACDPRFPYRANADTVRFLTLEAEQSSDLNDDGDENDLLVQLYNIRSEDVRVISEVFDPGGDADDPAGSRDPLDGSDTDPAEKSGAGVVITDGRCLELGGSCNINPSQCDVGEICVDDGMGGKICGTERGTCASDADCPVGTTCLEDPVVAGIVDTDSDELPDGLDNCVTVPNVDQEDLDQDGVGDACDLETCGDAVVQLDEECDDGNLDDDDACSNACKLQGQPTSGQAKCINAMNKSVAKIEKTAGKQIAFCLKANAKGDPFNPGDPSVDLIEECVVDDLKGKIQKVHNKTSADFTKNCTAPPSGKLTDPFPSFAATTDATVKTAATAMSRLLVHDLFGGDLDAVGLLPTSASDDDTATCQQKIWKSVSKCSATRLKEFNKCKKNALRSPLVTSSSALEEECLMQAANPATGQPDVKGKIAKLCTGKIDSTLTKCTGVDIDLAAPGDCAGAGGHAACMDRLAACRACSALNTADGLSRDCDLFDNGAADASCF